MEVFNPLAYYTNHKSFTMTSADRMSSYKFSNNLMATEKGCIENSISSLLM